MENVFFSFDLSLLLVALGGFILYLVLKKRKEEYASSPAPRTVPREPQTFKLSIRVGEEGRWQIVDDQGRLPGTLFVRPGDMILWRTGETDARFQFPRLELFDQLQEPWTQIGKNDTLRLTVSSRACPGSHVYAVFCNVDERIETVVGYAEGGSPPEIYIERY